MSATRSSELPLGHREGPDLDALVAEIAAEHPQPVRFLDVDRVRRGGVLGFFAKEQYALTYEVAGVPPAPSPLEPPARHRSSHAAPRAAAEPVDLEDLLGRADARDARPALALVPPPETAVVPSEVAAGDRFADILYGLARDVVDEPIAPAVVPAVDVAGRHRAAAAFEPTPLGGVAAAGPVVEPERERVLDPGPERTSSPGAVSASEPASVPEPLLPATVPSPPVVGSEVVVPVPEAVVAPAPPAPAPLATASLSAADARLLALGVPATHRAAGTADPDRVALVAALVGAVDALPVAPDLPTAAGDLVVVVGDAAACAVSGLAIAARLGTAARPVAGRTAARAAVAAVRAGDTPGLLQIAAGDPALADVVAGADAVVVAVEATGKTSDHRQLVARVDAAGGRVAALAVERVAATSSPASVWEVGLPVLTLDGHPADTTRWLAVLLDAARDL